MNKAIEKPAVEENEMREEYDFSQMTRRVRGKYYEEYQKGTNVVLLAPDVAKALPDSEAVNNAVRKTMRQDGARNNAS